MHFDQYQTLQFDRLGKVLQVTLNRPDKLNAVDEEMHGELACVFSDVANDPDSDVIVLTGAGRAFSAGGDIDWMQKMIDIPHSFEKTAREGRRIIHSLLDCQKPIIAKVNGHATGLGATMALFCDVIFASESAKIGDPHVSVGLVAGDGGAVIWPQLIGYARAKEYLLTGDLMSATEAGAGKSIRWTKASVNMGLKQMVQTVLETSLAYEEMSSKTADHQEAVNAFREKRTPQFQGR